MTYREYELSLMSMAVNWIILPPRCYYKLIETLQSTLYFSSVLTDENRVADAIEFRKMFCEDDYYISQPVSILEVLVALSVRVDESILSEPGEEQPWMIFDKMLSNLGLLDYTDDLYDSKQVDDILKRFLERDYGPYGEGSIVRFKHPKDNLKDADLWYQLMWYLSENN